jgi:arginine utilization regulatory protein
MENLKWGISSTELLSQIFNDFSTGVTIVDTNSEIVYYNKAQGQIDNMNPSEALGKNINDVQKVVEGTYHPTTLAIISRQPLINHASFYTTLSGKLVNSIQNIFAIVKDGVTLGCASFSNEYGRIIEGFNLNQGEESQNHGGNGSSNHSREQSICQIITNEKSMFANLDIVSKAADSPSSILICGERGTGKDLFARLVHKNSSRRENPFLVLNCASIPESILEGILFGTVEGAFTLAVDRPGMLELANGGTLFLDEINSIPQGLQTKIAQTLKEGTVRRVGSSNGEIDFSVKLVSGTSGDPQEAIAKGILKPELVIQLGVVMVSLPPLRTRQSDIPLLTSHFIQKMNEKLGKKVSSLSDDIKEAFNGYSWPGNVTELENAIEGAMNLVQEDESILKFQHFNATLLAEVLKESRNPKEKNPETRSLHFLHRPVEAERIAAALEAAGGNAAKAARSLKISPQLMNYKLKKFSLKKKITVHVE